MSNPNAQAETNAIASSSTIATLYGQITATTNTINYLNGPNGIAQTQQQVANQQSQLAAAQIALASQQDQLNTALLTILNGFSSSGTSMGHMSTKIAITMKKPTA